MKRQLGITQTTAWILALLGALSFFGILFLVSDKLARNYEEKRELDSMAITPAHNSSSMPDEEIISAETVSAEEPHTVTSDH